MGKDANDAGGGQVVSITSRRIKHRTRSSSSSSTSSSSTSSSASSSSKIGRPPKGGRDATKIAEQSTTDQGIWTYFTSAEREQLRNRPFHSEDFHVAITDDNGHDVKKQIRLHPMMMNELSMFVARGNFPVESVDDIIRAGTFWFMGIMYLLEKKSHPGVPNPMPMLAAINRLAKAAYYTEAFEATYENVKAQAEKMIARGRERMAAVFIYDVIEEVKQIPQKAYRDPWLQQIREDYGELLRRMAKSVKVLRRGKKGSEQKRKYIASGTEE